MKKKCNLIDNASTAFQRIGPGSSDEQTNSFVVDYYPCKYRNRETFAMMNKSGYWNEFQRIASCGPISTFRTDWLYNSAN